MKKFLALGLMLATSQQAMAEKLDYTFDTVHTQVIFFVDHLGFSKSEGEFTRFGGSFAFDPENWSTGEINVVIEADSVDMGNEPWNVHMKNADFFDVTKHKTLTFKSTAIQSADQKTGTVTGDLTILGVTKPVTLDVTFNRKGIHPYSKKMVAGFSAKGTVKRSEFGMKYGLPHIGDDIELRFEVEGVR